MTKNQKTLCLIMAGFVFLTAVLFLADNANNVDGSDEESIEYVSTPTTTTAFTAPPNVFLAPVPADEEEFIPCYPLSNEERILVEAVVMGEAEGEGYTGQMLVAQCLLNACRKDGIRPAEVIEKYQYSGYNEAASVSVGEAVSAVFDEGKVAIENEDMLYFYAPAVCASAWHESRTLVIEHGGHRFFE